MVLPAVTRRENRRVCTGAVTVVTRNCISEGWMMNTNRRTFLQSTVAAGISVGAAALTPAAAAAAEQTGLRPMTGGIVPITIDERRAASKRRAG